MAETLDLMGKIHDIWGKTAALTGISLFTGRVPPLDQQSTPYVRAEQPIGSAAGRSNKNLYPGCEIVFHIWTDDFESGNRISNAIIDAYASQGFDFDGGKVLDMRFTNNTARRVDFPEVPQWETIVTFAVLTERARTR
jgi:hypothetical protein